MLSKSRRRNGSSAPLKKLEPKPWRTEGLPTPHPDADDRRRRPRWRVWLYLVVGYLLIFGLLSFQDSLGRPVKVPYTEFTTQVERHNVAEVFSRGETIDGTLREPQPLPGQGHDTKNAPKYQRFTTERPAYAQDNLLKELEEGGATVSATPLNQDRGIFWNLLISVAPTLLLFGFWYWLFRRAQAMGGGAGLFGIGTRKRKPVDPASVRVTFNDIAGIDEVKAEINEIVDYLRDPGKYRKLGARAPKGVLLSGPPGTGKTLLARATAGEAGVPFFSASGSEFIEMIVGVGASRVRELFEEARKVAPSIIFIDEIDTIGRARGSVTTIGGHDEREQTLNQILTEMDGFTGSEGVVVIAATNRPDVLDPALLRPGRFDRTVTVNPPDRKGRADILRVHTRNVPLADDVDLDRLAAATPGMTGADLANLVNEAALAAARNGQTDVTDRDLFGALEKVQLGAARNLVLPPEERRRTAYHEAGHALLGILQPGADPVRKVSIIPRGHALGITLSTPEEDRYGYTTDYLRGRIIGALGGMVAEEEVFGVVSTGSESDLENATSIARAMVGRWGMSERIGPVSVLPREGDPHLAGISDSMLGTVDQEVRRLIDNCYAEARELVRGNMHRLERIVSELLAHETLDEEELYAAAGLQRATELSADVTAAAKT
ncbi:MAG: ATP-dependent zinc metalloprotease FtsH [Mycobacterium sp.]|uniref:ATP-dependent zinc metalloprotease FtsH n=1 Tax=Mycobacterium sp. TaxID=1785 RepID=UPI002611CAFF|nr:ATP-dependent zinc metalloprotease FtsH [Mycobacterium sp.]MDI3314197.1 ATP-dependent zinc metalloprotease FtsH [Mycobacterium sp.]